MLENVKACTVINSDEFMFENYPIIYNDNIYRRIIGKSYIENNDISLDDLTYVKLLHYNYDGKVVVGELIINKNILEDFEKIFRELFSIKYEINQMRLIDDFWENDALTTDRKSVENNNSSCFCYRKIIGHESLSNHSLGLAIDINPFDNPYTPRNSDGSFDDSLLSDIEKENLVNRYEKAKKNRHLITLNDDICNVFSSCGYECGGIWPLQSDLWSLDWQHFEPTDEKKKLLMIETRKLQ